MMAAQAHADRHVVKMILETAQILCTVLNELGYSTPYKSTHKNHPSVMWAKKSKNNFLWLKELGLELGKEYTYRYGKIHKSALIIENLPDPDENKFKEKTLTSFALAMPEQYKTSDPVVSYRNYYLGAKKDIMKYTKREVPIWAKL